MCFIPLEPRQHYGTSAGSFSSKNAKAEGTALGPRRRPTRGRGQSPRGCLARAVRPPRPRRANLSFPEAATTAAIPSSACDSWSHSAKPQLAEPQQPATAEVRPPCQETLHPSAWRQRAARPVPGVGGGGHREQEHILTRWDSALSSPSSAATKSVWRPQRRAHCYLPHFLSISESQTRTRKNLNGNFRKFFLPPPKLTP